MDTVLIIRVDGLVDCCMVEFCLKLHFRSTYRFKGVNIAVMLSFPDDVGSVASNGFRCRIYKSNVSMEKKKISHRFHRSPLVVWVLNSVNLCNLWLKKSFCVFSWLLVVPVLPWLPH